MSDETDCVRLYKRSGESVKMYRSSDITDAAMEDLHDERKRFASILSFILHSGDLRDIEVVAERELHELIRRTNGL